VVNNKKFEQINIFHIVMCNHVPLPEAIDTSNSCKSAISGPKISNAMLFAGAAEDCTNIAKKQKTQFTAHQKQSSWFYKQAV
jgi:hypothetical protein